MLLLQTALPDYRQAFLVSLARRLGRELRVMSGTEYFTPTVRTAVDVDVRLDVVRNHFVLGRRFLWQGSAVLPAIRASVVVVELNPRILSNWLIILTRRVLRRRTLAWGHAWPRRGRGARSDVIRKRMRQLVDGLILYTETHRRELADDGFGRPMWVAPNALYASAGHAVVGDSQRARRDVLFVGRLVVEKKPLLLLRAFVAAAASLGPDARLIFIGAGPEEETLRAYVREAGFGARVVFEGHVSDPERLAPIYAHAMCAVSPGPVGLSLTQALWFGVPMIIAEGEPHGPEVEAAVPDENSVFFRAGDVDALAAALKRVWEEREQWLARAAPIARDCRTRYSAEAMADGFEAALRGHSLGCDGVR